MLSYLCMRLCFCFTFVCASFPTPSRPLSAECNTIVTLHLLPPFSKQRTNKTHGKTRTGKPPPTRFPPAVVRQHRFCFFFVNFAIPLCARKLRCLRVSACAFSTYISFGEGSDVVARRRGSFREVPEGRACAPLVRCLLCIAFRRRGTAFSRTRHWHPNGCLCSTLS